MNNLVSITDQKAVTSSLIVADTFEKKHKNVLQAIENMECPEDFRGLNFQPTSVEISQPHGGMRLSRAYNITRDGFSFRLEQEFNHE